MSSRSLTPVEPCNSPRSTGSTAAFLKDPLPPLDSQDDLFPQDALGRFIYTQLPSSLLVRQQSPTVNHPETGANTSGKTMVRLKRRREEETDPPQPQTPRRFGDGLTNTQRAKSVPPLQPANKRPRLGPAFDIEIRSRTETFEKAIKKLQSEVQESFDKQADLLRAILDVLKDGNR